MIVKTFLVILLLNVALISDVSSASYSNVYVESEVVPVGYYTYGPPYASMANPKLSQINSLPAPTGYVSPCVPPCVYPGQTVAVNPNPNILTYSAPVPNVPAVVAPPKQEATAYEYSYAVYDENTGDHKSQRELSDGSVVRGEYSFIQPDGYVREVQYVADDVSGFNAVVKNFLPVVVEGKSKGDSKDNEESSPPCHEVKVEAFKQGSEENFEGTSESQEAHQDKSIEQSEIQEKLKHSHKKPKKESKVGSEEVSQENNQSKSKKVSNEESIEELEVSSEERKGNKKSKAKSQMKNKNESGEKSAEESESEESKNLKEKSRKTSSKESESSEKQKKKAKTDSNEELDVDTEEEISHVIQKAAQELLIPQQEVLVPYNDIIRCIEAAMKRSGGVSAALREEPSALTYIVLNRPC